ncbi:hypothetical protein H6G65_15485 [Microcystis elabens FACHB-917]|nr:hypothetical protein [Microcystis elabens FACHB-917]
MLLADISELKPCKDIAIIINCSTKLVSTLALLSTLRNSGMPVLLIDCESVDGSLDHFLSLMERYEFDVLSRPLQEHGRTLDWIFRHLKCENALLVDSDQEITNPKIITIFKDYIDESSVFGCGFTNGLSWLNDPIFGGLQGALYHERPWMPLTLLKVAAVREALAHGKTFAAFTLDNEYSLS